MLSRTITLALAALLLLAPLAGAQSTLASGGVQTRTSDTGLSAGAHATVLGHGGGAYAALGEDGLVALYAEDNGCPGLQREPSDCDGDGAADPADTRLQRVDDPVGVPSDAWRLVHEQVSPLYDDAVGHVDDAYATAVGAVGDAYATAVAAVGCAYAALLGQGALLDCVG